MYDATADSGSLVFNIKNRVANRGPLKGHRRTFATDGAPYGVFLHQRHYGGAWRQVLDASSETRGDIIEDAVETMFDDVGIPYIRTGSHNQAEIAARFEVTVIPAPDFVVFDDSDNLRALLECKGANDGGTARDKALRFERLHAESMRLGGIPLVAVLGGLGWTGVNDTLGPVVRDCDGRVFSVPNVDEMLSVSPFPAPPLPLSRGWRGRVGPRCTRTCRAPPPPAAWPPSTGRSRGYPCRKDGGRCGAGGRPAPWCWRLR